MRLAKLLASGTFMGDNLTVFIEFWQSSTFSNGGKFIGFNSDIQFNYNNYNASAYFISLLLISFCNVR